MILFIYFCMLILNVIAMFLTYRFLGNELSKKEKWIFIAVGIAIIYILVSTICALSIKDVDLGQASQTVQKLITFSFVPVNAILVLPIMASSYRHLKAGRLKKENFKNRIIVIVIVLIIVLVIEFFYFKDIQIGIRDILQNVSTKQ